MPVNFRREGNNGKFRFRVSTYAFNQVDDEEILAPQERWLVWFDGGVIVTGIFPTRENVDPSEGVRFMDNSHLIWTRCQHYPLIDMQWWIPANFQNAGGTVRILEIW